jgi:hypothetical protein
VLKKHKEEVSNYIEIRNPFFISSFFSFYCLSLSFLLPILYFSVRVFSNVFIVRSLREVLEMNAYKAGLVCLSVRLHNG